MPHPSGADEDSHLEAPDMTIRLQDECDLDEKMRRRRRDLEASCLRGSLQKSWSIWDLNDLKLNKLFVVFNGD